MYGPKGTAFRKYGPSGPRTKRTARQRLLCTSAYFALRLQCASDYSAPVLRARRGDLVHRRKLHARAYCSLARTGECREQVHSLHLQILQAAHTVHQGIATHFARWDIPCTRPQNTLGHTVRQRKRGSVSCAGVYGAQVPRCAGASDVQLPMVYRHSLCGSANCTLVPIAHRGVSLAGAYCSPARRIL